MLDLLGADIGKQWFVDSVPTPADRNPMVIGLRKSPVTTGQKLVRRLHEAGVPIRTDPFESLDALDEIDGVVLCGRWIGRTELDSILTIAPAD